MSSFNICGLIGLTILFLFTAGSTTAQVNNATDTNNSTIGAPVTSVSPSNQTGPLTIGFVYVSNPKDFGWVYQCYFAQAALEDYFGKSKLKVLFQYDVSSTMYASVARNMIANGAKVLFSSSSLESTMVAFAKTAPNTKFVSTPGQPSSASKNVAVTIHNGHQAFFLGGVMAGRLSKSKKAGFIAGNWLAFTIKCADAFLLGARTVDPNFQVFVVRVPSTLDALRQRKAVETLIQQQDADVFTGITATSAIVETAVNNGKLAFGYPSDGRLLYGENVYSGCQMEWFTALKYFCEVMNNNSWVENFTLPWGMSEGNIALSHLSSLVDAPLQQSVANWTKAIEDGSYCMFSRDVPALNRSLNASLFDSKGCLKYTPLLNLQVIVDGVINLGSMPDDQVFEKIYVQWNSSSGVALTIIIVIFDALMLTCIILVMAFKGTMIIVATNIYFCLSVLIGALFGYSGLFFWIGEPDDNICASRIWFLTLAFTFIFGAIAGKTYKMWRIWSNPNISEDGRSNITLHLFLALFTSIMILLLGLITGLGGYVSSTVTDSNLQYNQYYVSCTLTNSGVIILSIILSVCGVITFLASVLAFLSRNVHKRFNETSSIVLSIYNILIAEAVVVLLFLNTNTSDPRNHLIFISCGAFIAITCPIVYMFAPKLFTLMRNHSRSRTSRASASFSKTASVYTGSNETKQ